VPVEITQSNFQKEVRERKGLILVDFWAEWCGPCKILSPLIEEVGKEVGSKAEIGKLNVDENPDMTMEFNVMGIPTTILFKDGQPVEQFVGLRRKEDYIQMIEKHAA
jgi:thioredoxin 1